MDTQRWPAWAPLLGIAFVLLVVIAFLVGGETPTIDDSPQKILDFYNDNDGENMFGLCSARVGDRRVPLLPGGIEDGAPWGRGRSRAPLGGRFWRRPHSRHGNSVVRRFQFCAGGRRRSPHAGGGSGAQRPERRLLLSSGGRSRNAADLDRHSRHPFGSASEMAGVDRTPSRSRGVNSRSGSSRSLPLVLWTIAASIVLWQAGARPHHYRTAVEPQAAASSGRRSFHGAAASSCAESERRSSSPAGGPMS